MRAIGYVRRSTDRQDESLEQQRARLEAFSKSQGWTLVSVYTDDAVSGSEMRRPGLDALLRGAEDASVDIVVTWDRNRLARPKDAVDGILLERRLQKLGKRIVYASTGQELNGSFSSGLISYVEHHQNGDYLRKLSRDTMRGLVARAKKGFWPGGPIPFGFDRLILDDGTPKRIVRDLPDGGYAILDPETGDLIECIPPGRSYRKQEHEQCTLIPSEPGRVRAIQQLFEGFAAGKPTRRLRDALNETGFRTSRGRQFTAQTLHPMLENPAYVGRCIYNRRTFSKWHRYADGSSVERQDEGFERRPESDWVVREDAWPALIDSDTFEKVQARRAESKKRGAHHRGNGMKSDYLLTGLGYCSVCGGKLTGHTHTSGKGYKTRYYTCSRHSSGYKDECPKRYTVPAGLVEDHIVSLIIEDLKKYRDDEKLHKCIEEELSELFDGRSDTWERLAERLSEVDVRLAKLREHLISMDPTTAQGLGLYDEAKALTEQRAELTEEMDRAKAERVTAPTEKEVRAKVDGEFDRLREVFDSGTIEEKRELVRAYVYRVEAVPERQTAVISLYPGVVSQMVAGAGFEPATFGL